VSAAPHRAAAGHPGTRTLVTRTLVTRTPGTPPPVRRHTPRSTA
jgi:hypothetical protein